MISNLVFKFFSSSIPYTDTTQVLDISVRIIPSNGVWILTEC